MRWALIDSGHVVNVVEQATQPEIPGHWVACGNACPGWAYDGTNFLPPAVVGPTPRRLITPGALKDRLGVATVGAIANSTNPLCVVCKEMLYDRKQVDLDMPLIEQMLGMLVQASLPEAHASFPGSGPLTAAQVTQILTAQVQDTERP